MDLLRFGAVDLTILLYRNFKVYAYSIYFAKQKK